jgi:ubiquitin-conjugating enzyme E2 W
MKMLKNNPPDNCKIVVGSNIRDWKVVLTGIKGSIYEGETFEMRMQFPNSYPAKPPSVYFVKPNIPRHEHVYSNGDICLNIIGRDWNPTISSEAIIVSILSMLSSAKYKSLPPDNANRKFYATRLFYDIY